MRAFRIGVLCALWFCAWGHASAQDLQTKHAIEFRLAEDAAAPGLIPTHVVGEARVVYLHPEVGLDDGDIRTAAVVKGPDGSPAVQVHLQPSGVKKFNAMATGKLPRPLAIIVGGRVISTPVIDGPLIDDFLDITGALTAEEASALARALSKGKRR